MKNFFLGLFEKKKEILNVNERVFATTSNYPRSTPFGLSISFLLYHILLLLQFCF